MIRTTLFSFFLVGAACAVVACTNSPNPSEESSQDDLTAASTCPTLTPPSPQFCPNGTIKPRKEDGCVVGFDCLPSHNPCLATLCVEGTTCQVQPDGTPACLPSHNPCLATLCVEGTTCKVQPDGSPTCVPSANP
jgi:hypothetical protein